MLLSYDLYSFQSLYPYKLLTQNIESNHSFVSLDYQVLQALHLCCYFTELAFHVLFFSPIFNQLNKLIVVKGELGARLGAWARRH